MPYRYPQHNAVFFGNDAGKSTLSIFPLATRIGPLEAEEAFSEALAWLRGERKIGGEMAFMGWTDARDLPNVPITRNGIVGRAENLSILLQWDRNISAVDALREIEDVEGGLPAWLCAALLTAATAIEKKLDELLTASAVHFAACAYADLQKVTSPGALSRKELERIVDNEDFERLADSPVPNIRSGTDHARFMMLLGGRIMDGKWYKSRRQTLPPEKEHRLSSIAAVKISLDPRPKISVSGVELAIRMPKGGDVDPEKNLQSSYAHSSIKDTYILYDYLIQTAPPPEVLKAFFPSGSVDPTRFQKAVETLGVLKGRDNPAALHLTKLLIQEADENAAYAPQGLYRVLFPKELPLNGTGVEAANVYFEGDRIWTQFLFPGPCPALIPWRAKDFLEDQGKYPYTLSLIMAALSRDFRVSAEDSFPEKGKAKVAIPAPGEDPGERIPKDRKKSKSVRLLPVLAKGVRIWGSEIEREYILRKAHMVNAFRRRLPDENHRRGDALMLAAEHFIILPDEHYTIVLPHARGGRSVINKNTENAPVVRSRGLAASMAYANYLKEQEQSEGLDVAKGGG